MKKKNSGVIIKDVTRIKTTDGGSLELKTKSGVSILIDAGPSPGYINLETMLCGDDDQDLAIIVRIDWDQ